jgi:hypothetical protein
MQGNVSSMVKAYGAEVYGVVLCDWLSEEGLKANDVTDKPIARTPSGDCG